MPGSIQVSVLDFKELPSSSNTVKFSLGKVEHEVGENETFSFPLTNLRDNLIIKVEDSEGNQVSQSGVRTMSIIEKGTWDDVFPVEGGGFVHMKLQFFLSDEERNRIRLMRESAMKKKQAEILGSRQEVSDVLNASSSQDFQKSDSPNNSVEKETNEESTSNKDNAVLPQQTEVPEKQVLEDKNPNSVKKTSKESKFPPLSKERELKRLTVSEKVKSFPSKLAGEIDNQGSLEKTPQNIKKMISDFESFISQDRVAFKPLSSKSYRFGTSRLLKDNNVKDDSEISESSLKNSENSSSSKLRKSFSTGDLRKSLSNITNQEDQDEFDNPFVEPSEYMQSKGNDPEGTVKMETENNTENLQKSPHDGENSSGQWKGEEKESPESADAGASNGSFRKAMKIALVVGFGVLVFLFRKRESRKGNKKGVLRNRVFMNRRGSSEEQGSRIGVSRLS